LRRGLGGLAGHLFADRSGAGLGVAGVADHAPALGAVEGGQAVRGLLARLALRAQTEAAQAESDEFLSAVGVGDDQLGLDGLGELVEATGEEGPGLGGEVGSGEEPRVAQQPGGEGDQPEAVDGGGVFGVAGGDWGEVFGTRRGAAGGGTRAGTRSGGG
jgi:hypothetical protein